VGWKRWAKLMMQLGVLPPTHAAPARVMAPATQAFMIVWQAPKIDADGEVHLSRNEENCSNSHQKQVPASLNMHSTTPYLESLAFCKSATNLQCRHLWMQEAVTSRGWICVVKYCQASSCKELICEFKALCAHS